MTIVSGARQPRLSASTPGNCDELSVPTVEAVADISRPYILPSSSGRTNLQG